MVVFFAAREGSVVSEEDSNEGGARPAGVGDIREPLVVERSDPPGQARSPGRLRAPPPQRLAAPASPLSDETSAASGDGAGHALERLRQLRARMLLVQGDVAALDAAIGVLEAGGTIDVAAWTLDALSRYRRVLARLRRENPLPADGGTTLPDARVLLSALADRSPPHPMSPEETV